MSVHTFFDHCRVVNFIVFVELIPAPPTPVDSVRRFARLLVSHVNVDVGFLNREVRLEFLRHGLEIKQNNMKLLVLRHFIRSPGVELRRDDLLAQENLPFSLPCILAEKYLLGR
jgi:hypothetical protein